MELQKILPDIIKEMVKQTLETIMTAEREVFIKEHGETKNGFYVRNLAKEGSNEKEKTISRIVLKFSVRPTFITKRRS